MHKKAADRARSATESKEMKFIDLFSGLGGFHVASKRLGLHCAFASELNPELRRLYSENFGILPEGDIREVDLKSIPEHDLLCAGFPCQPFSKAGIQNGLNCKRWGDLFEYVVDILDVRRPKYFLLENVPNLLQHSNGVTWNYMLHQLQALGYCVAYCRLSPHQINIPQVRDRLYVVGSTENLDGFEWPRVKGSPSPHIDTVIRKRPVDAKPLADRNISVLDHWQRFLDHYPKSEELPSFPIWSMEFGADYPYEESTPSKISMRMLGRYRGCFGIELKDVPPSERLLYLPSYARDNMDTFPNWKKQFIRQNRELYEKNKTWLGVWIEAIKKYPASWQKFEWNCKGEKRNLWNHIIQFRASGIRVKRPTTAPSLVAMTTTQVPIVGWEKRYMTVRECARIQSIHTLKHMPSSETVAYKALGNAVNAEVVYRILRSLLKSDVSATRRRVLINA